MTSHPSRVFIWHDKRSRTDMKMHNLREAQPQVRLRECGAELIEVADNGPGIPPGDYQSVTLAHHTSKLARFTDLEVGQ